MFRKLCFFFFATALFVSLNAVAARASTTVFFNDVTSDSYNTTSCFPLYGTSVMTEGPIAAASEFKSLAGGNVTDIGVMLDYHIYTGEFVVEVWNSSYSASFNHNAPSDLRWTSAEYTIPTTYHTGTLVNVSVSGLSLTKDQDYFLVVRASKPTSDIDWHQALNGATGWTYQYYKNGSTWEWQTYSTGGYLASFNVEGNTSVPIPCTVLLLGSGLLGIAGFRKRIK
jgi:hypothetical protein